jgi:alkylation response protein AidB-like acyl-CoA dehydrogenase
MDYGFNPDQEALRALAQRALASAHDADAVWGELARAGLLGVALPVEHGGSGLGLTELGLLFEQAGRAAAPAALVPTLTAASTLAAFGSAEQARRLDGVANGTALVTVALHEPGGDPERPSTRAERDGTGYRLYGTKIVVPALERAAAAPVLVPARLPDGAAGLFLLAGDAAGVRRDAARATDDAVVHQLMLDGARVDGEGLLAPERGEAALAWLLTRLTIGWCAFELGVAQRQLEMTAEYCVRRQQFGKPIGLFQAVAQRAADMHIDVESLRLATWQATFLLDDGRIGSVADAAVATAAFWAAEAGARVALGAQHLHGGVGFDRAYPLHRYFLVAKRIELELGGANRQLSRLGRTLAAEDPR